VTGGKNNKRREKIESKYVKIHNRLKMKGEKLKKKNKNKKIHPTALHMM